MIIRKQSLPTTTLQFQPLTQANFADFGQVIETDQAQVLAINLGNTQRFHNLAQVQLGQTEDHAIINIFRSNRWQLPVCITMLEQHPQGSQAFYPLDDQPFLVVVGSKDASGNPNQLHGFVTNGKQGINFFTGVWHHPQLILGLQQDFLVIDRQGKGNNLIEQDLPESLCTKLDMQGLIQQYLA